MDFSRTKKSKFSTLTINDVEGSILIGKSWLYNYNTISGVLYWEDPSGRDSESGYKLVTLSRGSTSAFWNIHQSTTYCNNTDGCYNSGSQAFTLATSSYYPVIILKPNVKLKENSCSTKNKVGSKNCPYTLEWVDDVSE